MIERGKSLRYVIQMLLFAVLISPIASAGEPVELAHGIAPHHPQQPQIAVDAEGTIHAVYGVGDIVRYHRSSDGGKTFSQPVDLPAANAISLGMRRGPRIAAANAALCVTCIGGKQGKGRDGDLLAMRSGDGGKTWNGPAQVNDSADAAREGLHAMAAGPKGQMCCVWLDLRNRLTQIMSSTSVDGGGNWSKNVLVYKSPDGNVCECCHPSVAYDGRGHVHVQWRNWLDGSRDMYVASSVDGGKSFAKALKLGSGTWPLNACPMDGGAIAITSGDNVVSAWRRDKSVYVSQSGQRGERLLGPGEQPWIAATKDGPFVVWLKKRGDIAYLLTPWAKSPIEMATIAFDPVIAAGPNRRGPVVMAWESRDGKNHTIQCKVVGN